MSSQAPPAAKKKTSGVVILLWIFGAFGLLLLVGIGVSAFLITRSPEATGILKIFTEVVSMQAKATKAPGTKELRGLGCQQAMVMNFADVQKLMAPFEDAGASQEQLPFEEMVVCSVSVLRRSSAPTCDVAAKTYVTTVGPRRGPYVVMVQVQGRREPECSVVYAADGAKMGNMNDPESFGPLLAPPADGDLGEETQ